MHRCCAIFTFALLLPFQAVLEQVKALEAQVQALQVGAGEQQQQQAERLAARQSELAAAKAAALAVLHAAVEKRRRHEAEEHPEGRLAHFHVDSVACLPQSVASYSCGVIWLGRPGCRIPPQCHHLLPTLLLAAAHAFAAFLLYNLLLMPSTVHSLWWCCIAQGSRDSQEVSSVCFCFSPRLAGLHSFDLGRLEAAVSSVPASEFEGEQRALTQLSHSLLFRWVGTG